MKIEFTQIYPEPGANFDLPGPLLGQTSARLNKLRRSISALGEKLGGDDFELVLIISARHTLRQLEIKGPNVRRKAREAEFSLFIPWRSTSGYQAQAEYVLPWVAEGLQAIFARYGVSTAGVDDAIQEVLVGLRADPSAYLYAKVHDDRR